MAHILEIAWRDSVWQTLLISKIYLDSLKSYRLNRKFSDSEFLDGQVKFEKSYLFNDSSQMAHILEIAWKDPV